MPSKGTRPSHGPAEPPTGSTLDGHPAPARNVEPIDPRRSRAAGRRAGHRPPAPPGPHAARSSRPAGRRRTPGSGPPGAGARPPPTPPPRSTCQGVNCPFRPGTAASRSRPPRGAGRPDANAGRPPGQHAAPPPPGPDAGRRPPQGGNRRFSAQRRGERSLPVNGGRTTLSTQLSASPENGINRPEKGSRITLRIHPATVRCQFRRRGLRWRKTPNRCLPILYNLRLAAQLPDCHTPTMHGGR